MCVCLCIMSGLSEVPASWCWPPAAIISSDLVWNKYYSQSAAGWEWPVDTHCIVSVNCKLVSVTPGGPGAVCSLSLVSPSGTPAVHRITKFWTAAAAAGPGVNDWRWLSVTDWPLGPATGCCICKQSVLLWHRHRTPARRASHWLLLMLERNTDTAHPSQRGAVIIKTANTRQLQLSVLFTISRSLVSASSVRTRQYGALANLHDYFYGVIQVDLCPFILSHHEPHWSVRTDSRASKKVSPSACPGCSWLLLAAPRLLAARTGLRTQDICLGIWLMSSIRGRGTCILWAVVITRHCIRGNIWPEKYVQDQTDVGPVPLVLVSN